MQKSDFYYDLPEELIAQQPAVPRDAARLLCMDRETGALQHRVFSDLPSLLKKGDLLVVNDSKVLPARLLGQKEGSGGLCELLLLNQTQQDIWECLARPGRRLQKGAKMIFGDGTLKAEVLETLPTGNKRVSFTYNTQTLYEKLDEFGKMPLPPYIKKQPGSNDDYQTVYAKALGSAAAPTAGLHFTPQLLEDLQQNGIEVAKLTLHVGLGTFRPVKENSLEKHVMHEEWYSLSQEAAQKIEDTKKSGGRVIAVGTTSCRTLETIAKKYGRLQADTGKSKLFIYPGFEYKVIDGLITNFHLPESTLIMLVSAFCGYQHTMDAYKEAVEEKYRFFSFGDAMLII